MSFKFIDLFAGIGGFHAAISGLGGKCVAAVEIDKAAAVVYERNWGLPALGDITELANDEGVSLPAHDLLAAGFPCQPFSKSGAQRGMDETRGTLYFNILQIIEARRPALVLLENVRNLAGPRHVHEWDVIIQTLREQGYKVSDTPTIFSPHLLPRSLGGRPQVRERVFIVAARSDGASPEDLVLDGPLVLNKPVDEWNPLNWNLDTDLPLTNATTVPGCELSETEMHWLNAWNDFVVGMWELREGSRLPGFPLWGDDWRPESELECVIDSLTPKWKADFLVKNAKFYEEHRAFIDEWVKKWDFYSDKFPPSRRKLEWQAQDAPSLWDTVMQLRPSGIRVKRPTHLPALVAITQTSILGSRKRRLSPIEAARLQGLPEWFDFGDQPASVTYKQLGNGVSVGAIWHVLKAAAVAFEPELKKSAPKMLKAIQGAPLSPDDALADAH
jgi:DNA (cytosine-5)-methyltransferase 1